MGDNSDSAQLRRDIESDNRITGTLILCNGENVPQEIRLSGKMKTFGRAVNNDVVCNCLQISRKHAAFEYKNNKWFLIDMSTNGLSINGLKIDKGIGTELSHNDVILFIPTGALQYRFEYVDAPLLPNSTATSTSTNILQPSISMPDPRNYVSNGLGHTIPKPVINLANSTEDDNISNHSESLLGEDFPIITVPSDGSGFAGIDSYVSSSPVKTSQYSSQNKLNYGKEIRSKRPHGSPDEPGSSSAKRKFVTKDIKTAKIEELEQELPDIDDLDEELPEAQELPDIDEPIIALPKQKKIQSNTNNDILTCDDINVLRRRCLEYMQKLENHEAASQIQLIEKNIEYQKLFDKYSETESKAEVQKEELFKVVMDAMEREFGCCICNEVFIEATVIECGHTFCNFCISEWLRRNPECPICRAPSKKQTKHKEVENFIVTIHTMMSEEIRSKRELTLQERKKAIEKAEAEHLAAPRGRRGAIADLGADHNIIEFLTDMHMNQMFRVRDINRPRRGGTGRGAASTSRRSTRLQNLTAEASAAAGAQRTRGRGAGGRRGSRARAGPVATATTVPNPVEVPLLPGINPAPTNTNNGNVVLDQQPGPSRFMGFLGMVQRAAASAGVNLVSSNSNPSSSSTIASGLQNAAVNVNTLPNIGERIAPRLSDSVVLLSSDDDLELIDEALGGTRTRRLRTAPISIDFFANPDYNSSDTSDDDY